MIATGDTMALFNVKRSYKNTPPLVMLNYSIDILYNWAPEAHLQPNSDLTKTSY